MAAFCDLRKEWKKWKPSDLSVEQQLLATLRNGRSAQMPAQAGRLSESQIRVLAAWMSAGLPGLPSRRRRAVP